MPRGRGPWLVPAARDGGLWKWPPRAASGAGAGRQS
jgi:hypothetical protein